MRASEVIREAKNVLFERGWHQGDFEGAGGDVCIEAAFCHALGISYPDCTYNADWKRADQTMRAVLLERYGKHLASCLFNDRVAESFDEVIDVLDRAEKIAEQREAVQ